MLRKSVDQLYLRVQDLESRPPDVSQMEARMSHNVEVYVAEHIHALEQKVMHIIDGQGKDIASDFSELERKVSDLKDLVQSGFQETSHALLRLNDGEKHQRGSVAAGSFDYLEEQVNVSESMVKG